MEQSAARPDPQSLPTQGDHFTPEPEPRTAPDTSNLPAADIASQKSTAVLSPSGPGKPSTFVARDFGPYRLLGELGRGGMGVVYEARHVVLDRRLALKMIRPGRGGAEETERFLREAKAIAQLKHRNIVTMYDFGEIHGEHYFTMEIAERGSLVKHLERFNKSPREAVAFLAKVARVVQHVHDAGLMHRDLKPGNILLDADDEPILSDFGLAKPFTPSEDALTDTGVIPGTRAYMSPEQASGSSPACPQSDVWALGVILFEMVCGRKPFIGESEEKITTAILKSDPPEPRSLKPTVDRSLEAIMLMCLRKDPNRRYKTASALVGDLDRWLRGEPTEARPLTWTGRMIRRHRRALTVTAAVALVALVGVALAVQLDPDRALKREIMPALERSEAVVLLGETGKPKWSRWIQPGTETLKEGEPYEFNSGAKSMLELLPTVPLERYAFRAEVRHERSNGGIVGVYCCRTAHPLSWGVGHGLLLISFADWGRNVGEDPKTKNRMGYARLTPCIRSVPSHFHFTDGALARKQFVAREPARKVSPFTDTREETEALAKKLKKDKVDVNNQIASELEAKKDGWRRIRVHVTPQFVEWYWDGEFVTSLPREQRIKMAEGFVSHRPILEGIAPEFPPDGGLGLLVDEGRASFRNVIVEPLNE